MYRVGDKKKAKKEKEREKRDLGPKGFVLIRLRTQQDSSRLPGENRVCICLYLCRISEGNPKRKVTRWRDQVYQLTRKENLVIFPEGKTRKKARLSSSSGGSDLWPLGGRALVKYEGLVWKSNERCRGCASFLKKSFIICACLRFLLVNGYSVPPSLPPSSLSIFLFLLHRSLPRLFSSSAPIQFGLESESEFHFPVSYPDFLCVRSFWFSFLDEINKVHTSGIFCEMLPSLRWSSGYQPRFQGIVDFVFVKIKTRSYLCATFFFSLSYICQTFLVSCIYLLKKRRNKDVDSF